MDLNCEYTMKILRPLLPILILSLSISLCAQSVAYPDQLLQLHKNVWSHIMETPPDAGEVANLLASMQADGTWADIDYSSLERGGWQPRDHINRLLTIAKAYRLEGSPQYEQKSTSRQMHLALDYWLQHDLQCPNWWYPEIGVPMVLAPAMLLMENELSVTQMQQGVKILERSRIGKTGQNKVWLAGNVLLRSLLTKDVELIDKASAAIREELVVSLGEGVQPDWSYHQHGPQLQFGNYGLSYAGDMIKWITILRGTPYRFDESKLSILRNYLLEGQQWISWKDKMDISACGRQLFLDSPAQKAKSLAGSIHKMETLDPAFADQYRTANDYKNLSGNRHFWRSDIQVQRNPDYYFSVKMCSERVIGAESCNSENVQGYYMGDGATFLYQNGSEYENIFPFWDWKKIPGTTTQQDDEPLPVLTASGYRIESSFVGGVSDGVNGIAVLDYNRNGLRAKKSWFMFGDMIVCLGSGISAEQELPVTTSVNQAFTRGDALIKMRKKPAFIAGDAEYLNDPAWILHDQTGYFFPGGGHLQLYTRPEEGSWYRLVLRYPDEKLQADIFKLYFDHGMQPKHAAYSYVLVPGADKALMAQLEKEFPFQLVNEKDRQEVRLGEEMAGMVFYEAGASSSVLPGLTVDQPCVVMLKRSGTQLALSVADPTQQLKEIKMKLKGTFKGQNVTVAQGFTELTIALPQAAEAGKSVTVLLQPF